MPRSKAVDSDRIFSKGENVTGIWRTLCQIYEKIKSR